MLHMKSRHLKYHFIFCLILYIYYISKNVTTNNRFSFQWLNANLGELRIMEFPTAWLFLSCIQAISSFYINNCIYDSYINDCILQKTSLLSNSVSNICLERLKLLRFQGIFFYGQKMLSDEQQSLHQGMKKTNA